MTWCPQPSVLTLAAALCRPLCNLWCSDCVNPLQSLQLLTLPKPFKSGTQNLKFELGSSEKQCSLVFILPWLLSLSSFNICLPKYITVVHLILQGLSYKMLNHHLLSAMVIIITANIFVDTNSQPNALLFFLIFAIEPTQISSVRLILFNLANYPIWIWFSSHHCANLNCCTVWLTAYFLRVFCFLQPKNAFYLRSCSCVQRVIIIVNSRIAKL